jgi:tyrosinase
MSRLASPGPSDVNIVLTNDAPNIGGNLRFAAHVSPWPANTTATATSLSLTLPSSGAWVPFMIAGEFATPSINDKDAIIEIHENTAAGAIINRKALMVRVRKNANTLTLGEKNRLLFAFQKFRNKVGGMNYVLAQEIHRLASEAGDEAHHQPAFLTWHRIFLLMVERELQKFDPSVTLHYWDWDAASPNFFAEEFIGESGSGGGIAEPNFSLTNPLLGWDTNLPFSGGELRRNTSDHTVDPGSTMEPLDDPIDPSLIDYVNYGPNAGFGIVNSFSSHVERTSHDDAHGWPCGSGHLTAPSRSACDPLFYFLHTQIDREWAYWQQFHNRLGVISGGVLTFPNPAHYDNAGNWNSPGNTPDPDLRQKGSYLLDGLWPWDGTTGGAAGVEQRPPNIGTGVGFPDDIPISTPTIPATAFPASTVPNIWPPAPAIPINKDAIDYLGRFIPINGLGFCYFGVPY